MHAPTVRTALQLAEDDFTKADVAEFHRLMAEMVVVCKAIGELYKPGSEWAPTASGLLDQFEESIQVTADISRQLNKTRRGIRRITDRARTRRDSGHGGRCGHTWWP
ncbi:hypothetical protein BIV23_29205 [Streptomyces monashensis]|uniref:Uncharacterized protein n=1 Tax=Streptomyces monashensis TaxID=1678012 RepID=A0A1S2PYQ9_9ACTN|nr:hypothetical protein BIV23_29205 [Streptomyces monashensis]